jgi:hypothetical protein
MPYHAIALGLGLGHMIGLHEPDYTYNEGSWITRETRTFAMELDLRDAIRNSQWTDASRSTTANQFDVLATILREFNAIRENEQASQSRGSESWLTSRKVARLNQGLRELGYESIDLTSNEYRFDEHAARRLREQSFEDLDETHYTHAMLETD